MADKRKLSEEPLASNLLPRDRLVVLRSPLDEPDPSKRVLTVTQTVLAAALAQLLPSVYKPFAPEQLNGDKQDYAQLSLQDLLLKLVNEAITTLPDTPTDPTGPATPMLSVSVDAQRVATVSPAITPGDYEYQFRTAPTVSAQRSVDMSQTLAPGESFSDYEYQTR